MIQGVKKLLLIVAVAALALGTLSIASERKAEAFGCYCIAYDVGGNCASWGSYAPDLLPGARWCHSGYSAPAANEHAVYTSTNYGGYCMAFTPNITATDLNPSGWHPGNYCGWRISSYKKGSSLPSNAGVRVYSGPSWGGASAIITWSAPDMTGMDIRSIYSSNF